MNVEERVHKIIKKVTGATDVNNTQELVQDVGADSLDVVEIIMDLEKEFKIEINDDEVDGIKKVGDIVNKVQERINI